jgi:hypothetical protein
VILVYQTGAAFVLVTLTLWLQCGGLVAADRMGNT